MDSTVLAFFRYMKYPKKITRFFIKSHPEINFVFGDNLTQRGYGGQAKECRGEPNCFGVPTKRCPEMDENASFFSDVESMLDTYIWYIDEAIKKIPNDKPIYIIPGIGTGLSKMNTKAPALYKYMIESLNSLENVVNKKEF